MFFYARRASLLPVITGYHLPLSTRLVFISTPFGIDFILGPEAYSNYYLAWFLNFWTLQLVIFSGKGHSTAINLNWSLAYLNNRKSSVEEVPMSKIGHIPNEHSSRSMTGNVLILFASLCFKHEVFFEAKVITSTKLVVWVDVTQFFNIHFPHPGAVDHLHVDGVVWRRYCSFLAVYVIYKWLEILVSCNQWTCLNSPLTSYLHVLVR